MVILQFNKLIRNKWIWGAFAVAISAAFCFDDLFTGREVEERRLGDAGSLAGEAVKASEFSAIAAEVRGIGRNRDWKMKAGEANRRAWETLAALKVAEKAGLEPSDREVMETIRRDQSFSQNGAFSFALYQRLLRDNGISPEEFEAFMRRRLTVARIGEAMLDSATWVSPMELDRAVADVTDVFTVKVARFSQTKAEADAIKLDEAGLRKWYDANTNSIALPARLKLRLVKFDATDKKVLEKMSVSENEMRDHYDATIDKYTSTGTNGTEVVKKFEEVKAGIEKELRQIAAVQFFETNVNRRVYGEKAEKGVSRLDVIAKEDGLKVTVSDWFAPEGGYVEGFMRQANVICPGAKNFSEAVAELDDSSEDLRYGIVSSDRAVWLIEKAEASPAHVPTFEEAKKAIEPRALRDARADAFKEKVEAIAKKGVKAVEAEKNISTNITFAICDMKSGAFENQNQIAGAARKLKKGEVSEFVKTGMRSGVLVVCVDRKEGDAAQATLMKSRLADEVAMLARRQLPESWQKWNLERMGFEPGEISSVEIAEDVE